MHEYVVDNFDWACYRNLAQSRFLDGREGALLSNGFSNIVALSVVFGLCWWALGIWVEFYAIRRTLAYIGTARRVLYLKDMAEYADDLLSLTQEHFNMVVKSRCDSVPVPVARIRMPASVNMRSVKMHVGSDSQLTSALGSPSLVAGGGGGGGGGGGSARGGNRSCGDGGGDNTALTSCLDNLGVSFTMDCNRTTFVSAHWGVPVSLLHDICVDTTPVVEESQSEVLYVKSSLKSFFGIFGDARQSLLDDRELALLNAFENYNEKLGQFNLLSYADKLCSNEPVCYDAGTDIECTIVPPVKAVEVDNEVRPIWEVLLNRFHRGEEIMPLVIVLYSPRRRDYRILSEGDVESYQGIAEITLVGFKGTIRPFPTIALDPDVHTGIKVDMEKQVCFANDFERPQEPREMFGMGDVDNECLICIANRMDTLLLPCGHSSFCSQCLQSLRNEKCPVCRGMFTSYIKFPLVDSVEV